MDFSKTIKIPQITRTAFFYEGLPAIWEAERKAPFKGIKETSSNATTTVNTLDI
jgi:hypothetical protein